MGEPEQPAEPADAEVAGALERSVSLLRAATSSLLAPAQALVRGASSLVPAEVEGTAASIEGNEDETGTPKSAPTRVAPDFIEPVREVKFDVAEAGRPSPSIEAQQVWLKEQLAEEESERDPSPAAARGKAARRPSLDPRARAAAQERAASLQQQMAAEQSAELPEWAKTAIANAGKKPPRRTPIGWFKALPKPAMLLLVFQLLVALLHIIAAIIYLGKEASGGFFVLCGVGFIASALFVSLFFIGGLVLEDTYFLTACIQLSTASTLVSLFLLPDAVGPAIPALP